jgi:hypothetical protein
MKAETKTILKKAAFVMAAIVGFIVLVSVLPVKVTIAAVFIMQFVTLVAVGGTNLMLKNEQKKQGT